MAVIYSFPDNPTPRLLRDVSRQTGGVVDEYQDYSDNLQALKKANRETGEILQAFNSELTEHKRSLEMTLNFIQKCSRACKLKTVEDMINERDTITQQRCKLSD